MHQLLNVTPFAAAVAPSQDRDGRDLLLALVKATYRFTALGDVAPAPPEEQLPVFLADVPWGDPATTSLRYASDVVPARSGTDVAIVGHAWGRGRKEVEVGFRIGSLDKTLLASGPRAWVAGFPVAIAGPVPFEKLPLRYEQAFGGGYDEEGRGRVAWPENPVGCGFAMAIVDRAPLPGIEHRDGRYKSPRDRPTPAGLGFVPAGWKQRAAFAGTYDVAWEKVRRPLLPADLDERYWNAVPQDQVLRPRLAGGERLLLRGVHPESDAVTLTVPRLSFTAAFGVLEREEKLPLSADTLLVEPDEGRLSITFRATLAAGEALQRVKRIVIRGGEAAPAAAAPASSPRPPPPLR